VKKVAIRKKVIPFLELGLKKITEVSARSSEKGEKLVVSLDLGVAEWVNVVKNMRV
jgi:hypothetical protein